MREVKHLVKGPSRFRTIIGMIAIICSQAILVERSWDQKGVFYASNNQIILNGIVINPVDIKVIMSSGYRKPVIGILPQSRRMVPLNMVFRYSSDEDKAILDLTCWAKMNNVKMVNKSFKTWI